MASAAYTQQPMYEMRARGEALERLTQTRVHIVRSGSWPYLRVGTPGRVLQFSNAHTVLFDQLFVTLNEFIVSNEQIRSV
jgi:hypothetical protein